MFSFAFEAVVSFMPLRCYCVCGKTFTLFIFISNSLIFIRSSFLHTHDSIIHKICIHVQQYLNKLCHLRQSIHLQKKVKEKIAERLVEEQNQPCFSVYSPRMVPLQLKFIHKTQTHIRSMCLYILEWSVIICALTGRSGWVSGLSSPGHWSWSSSDDPLMSHPTSACHWHKKIQTVIKKLWSHLLI